MKRARSILSKREGKCPINPPAMLVHGQFVRVRNRQVARRNKIRTGECERTGRNGHIQWPGLVRIGTTIARCPSPRDSHPVEMLIGGGTRYQPPPCSGFLVRFLHASSKLVLKSNEPDNIRT